MTIEAGTIRLDGWLTVPEGASQIVVFAHGSGSSRHSSRNQYVASVLNDAGLGTLLFDLLTAEEELNRANVFNVGLLAGRLAGAVTWLRAQPRAASAAIGYFGASTGAAAALRAAAEPGADIAAVVSRGGRPDLARPRLGAVTAPTLLIVGGHDEVVLDLNRRAQAELRCENDLAVVPGASHLFEEPGALDAAAELARGWFRSHLARGYSLADLTRSGSSSGLPAAGESVCVAGREVPLARAPHMLVSLRCAAVPRRTVPPSVLA